MVLVLALFLGRIPGLADTALERRLAGSGAPARVMASLVRLTVPWRDDSGGWHRGELVVHRAVQAEVAELFDTLARAGFPLTSVRPLSDFGHSDSLSMAADNTSGFAWRNVAGTRVLSAHAWGLALDLNPARNPWERRGRVRPVGARRDPSRRGTLTDTSLAVRFLRARGWTWGGRWTRSKDWQHFEKRDWRRIAGWAP